MSNGLEQYTDQFGKLSPLITTRLQRFFGAWTLHNINVEIVGEPDAWMKSKGVPAYVLDTSVTIRIVRGALNHEGTFMKACFDLSRPYGMATLAHECRHCWQHANWSKAYLLWQYSIGYVRSWLKGKAYDHAAFAVEQDATGFAYEVQRYFETNLAELRIFEDLRP